MHVFLLCRLVAQTFHLEQPVSGACARALEAERSAEQRHTFHQSQLCSTRLTCDGDVLLCAPVHTHTLWESRAWAQERAPSRMSVRPSSCRHTCAEGMVGCVQAGALWERRTWRSSARTWCARPPSCSGWRSAWQALMPLGHKLTAAGCEQRRRGIAKWVWLGVTCWGKPSCIKVKAVAKWIALMCGALFVCVGVPREV